MITTIEQWKTQTNYPDGVLATAATLIAPPALVKDELNELKALVDIVYGNNLQSWSAAVTYTEGRIVNYSGSLYVALALPTNINQQPDTATTYWRTINSSDYPRGPVIKISAAQLGDNALNGVIPVNSGMVEFSTVDEKLYLVTDPASTTIFGYLDITKMELSTSGLVTVDSVEAGTWTAGEFIYLSLDSDGLPVDAATNNSTTKLGIAYSADTFYLSLAIGASSGSSTGIADVTRLYFTATASQTVFNITGGYEPGHVDVFQDGLKLSDAEFSSLDGTNIILTTGAPLNSQIDMIVYRNLALVDVYSKNQTNILVDNLGIDIESTLQSANILNTTWVGENVTVITYTTGNVKRYTYDGTTFNITQMTITDTIDTAVLLTVDYVYDIDNNLESTTRTV
jgi:hypothetical protein